MWDVAVVFFFNDTATTEIYTYGHTLSLHDALPICPIAPVTTPRRWLVWILRPKHSPKAPLGPHAQGHDAGVGQVRPSMPARDLRQKTRRINPLLALW